MWHGGLAAIGLTILSACTPTPTATPTQTPADPPASSGIYGPGIAGDSKNNERVNGAMVSHRFRAGTSSELRKIRFATRMGSGYSAGNGGTMRVSVQTDDGSSAHLPSGTILSSLSFRPGNSGIGTFGTYTFDSPATLTEGRLYHIVFQNTDGSPTSNYISVNELFVFERDTPRQPALSDEYAVLYHEASGGWTVQRGDTADMDLVYADGSHDGQAYIGVISGSYGLIGGSNMVREHFTVSGGDRTISRAWVRVGQQSGSGALTVRLETGGGTLIDSGSVSASAIPAFSPGSDADNGDWVSVDFGASHVLQDGKTYVLRLSAPSGTQYSMVPIRDGNDDAGGNMASYAFRDGSGQRSTDGGSSWADLYRWSPVDMQFYLR